jgi:flagellar protein FliO/FliZ
MDLLAMLRMMGALGVVLGLLAGVLWLVRRYDIKLPNRVGGGTVRRLELVERLTLDQRRSVALIRRDGREHLILLGPEGAMLVEAGIISDDRDAAAQQERSIAAAERTAKAEADVEAMRESFAAMVDNVNSNMRQKMRGAREVAVRLRSGTSRVSHDA